MEIKGKTEILEKNNCQNWETLKSINTKKKELEALRQKNMDCVCIQSRAKWITEGEQITSYFCKLENRNVITKSISQIEKKRWLNNY